MHIFEQHSMSEGACQFAIAALEQVDIIADLDNGIEAQSGQSPQSLPETAAMIKGRLWANVFKYSLDLKHFRDAYCAIISNPDEDSKYICLRRFIIVLCELGETKVWHIKLLILHYSSPHAMDNILFLGSVHMNLYCFRVDCSA